MKTITEIIKGGLAFALGCYLYSSDVFRMGKSTTNIYINSEKVGIEYLVRKIEEAEQIESGGHLYIVSQETNPELYKALIEKGIIHTGESAIVLRRGEETKEEQ